MVTVAIIFWYLTGFRAYLCVQALDIWNLFAGSPPGKRCIYCRAPNSITYHWPKVMSLSRLLLQALFFFSHFLFPALLALHHDATLTIHCGVIWRCVAWSLMSKNSNGAVAKRQITLRTWKGWKVIPHEYFVMSLATKLLRIYQPKTLYSLTLLLRTLIGFVSFFFSFFGYCWLIPYLAIVIQWRQIKMYWKEFDWIPEREVMLHKLKKTQWLYVVANIVMPSS